MHTVQNCSNNSNKKYSYNSQVSLTRESYLFLENSKIQYFAYIFKRRNCKWYVL